MQSKTFHSGLKQRALVVAGLGLTSFVQTRLQATADDQAVSRLSQRVRDAASRLAPKARWSSVEADQEDDRDVYELTGKDGQGRTVILEISDDGKVTEFRAELPLTKVPKDVWKIVAGKFPKFEAMTAYELHQDEDLRSRDDGEMSYEVSGIYAADLQSILEITAEGAISELEQQIPVGDLPAAVLKAVKSKLPMLQITTAYELSQDGDLTGYQLSGKRGRGKQAKELDLFVTADGEDVQIDE